MDFVVYSGSRHFSCFQTLLEQVGRLKSWKVRKLAGWKGRRLEGWKVERFEGWKAKRLEGWKVRRLDGWMEGWKVFPPSAAGPKRDMRSLPT